ncbi:MAG: hypothetical protein CFE21_05885 [Bacteroidetes bacterium B1(2017)]|nr:MAG: hypothetical protein CFE21_05885 [Bacteroidetes bacterium B1(2017)]
MKNRKLLCTIAFVFLIGKGVFAQQKGSYFFEIGLGANTLKPKEEPINSSSYGINKQIGLGTSLPIQSQYSFNTGMFFNLSTTNTYKNKVVHYSNWKQGPETTEVNLETSIRQSQLMVPLYLGIERKKFSYQVGLDLYYLLSGKLSQEVLGSYSVDKYPGYDSIYTESIKSVYTIQNSKNLGAFPQTNIALIFGLSKSLNKQLGLNVRGSYQFIKCPQFKSSTEAYHQINFNISITFKLKP